MDAKPSAIPQPVKFLAFFLFVAGSIFFLYEIRGVLAPFVLAFILAYILGPIVDRMEGSGMGRTSSILLVFLLVFTAVGFVAFKAGNKLSGEMRELSDRMQRDESTTRSFSILNGSDQPLLIEDARWDYIRRAEGRLPFVLRDSLAGRNLAIAPGETRELFIQFMPDSLVLAQAVLYLSLGGDRSGQMLVLPIVGNRERGDGGDYSLLETASSKPREAGVEIQPPFLDMGEAGPNVFTDLAKSAEAVQPTVQKYWGDDFDLVTLVKEQGDTMIDTLLGSTTVFLGGVVSGLTFVVIVPFVAFFFLKEGSQITRTIVEWVPNAYFELCLNLLHQINGQIGGYIRGQILATSVVATLAISALSIIDLKYALPVGLLAGFANMIPFLGPLIGIISASIVALATGGELAMALVGKVVVIFLVIQLVDNVLIQPTVVAKSVEMHPLMVLFVVMVGSQLMGIVGMLIAVPLTGILKVSIQTAYEGLRGYRLQ